ncbi:conjugal transfer protein [Actinomadura sp. PM05-2]|uniref:Conjugal transfer protein n=2 Tax=Actinomadura parmotrematis TaxID=2864039 RepID=A0ABS7FM97_9ACTN|nr:conjugal transfer protein [Actinomadura parmotrematis]
MARRSAVHDGRDTAVAEDAGAPASFGPTADPWEPPGRQRRRGRSGGGGGGGSAGRWGGSGGRWWVWVGRAVLWAVIVVIVVNGVRAPFERFTAKTPAAGPTAAPQGTAPAGSAVGAFALQFATVYLNYDQKNSAAREAQLKPFLPDDADPGFGWNGVGRLQVQSVQVAGVDVRDAGNATVTVLARSQDRWLRLAVPVYTKDGAMVIAGRPALLPPPAKATLPSGGVRDQDTALQTELGSVLTPFFQAYASGDQSALSRFADGASIAGLGNSVNFVQVRQVVAPRGAADARTVTATVAWQLAGANGAGNGGELEQAYELSMVKKSGTWYVHDIRGTTEPGAS